MTISWKELLSQREFWVFLFVLGAALLNWPMLTLASDRTPILGLPSNLVYIFAVWLAIIILEYLFDRGHSD